MTIGVYILLAMLFLVVYYVGWRHGYADHREDMREHGFTVPEDLQ